MEISNTIQPQIKKTIEANVLLKLGLNKQMDKANEEYF